MSKEYIIEDYKIGNFIESKLFKINCNTTNKYYIGCSIKPIKVFLKQVIYNVENPNRSTGKLLTEIINENNYTIKVIKSFESNDKSDMLKKKNDYKFNNNIQNSI
tara:strand:- start:174 stop:488 length:315 start_codon:yes stop_codon:yes gene_type:complete